MYLKTISELADSKAPVSISALAKRLHVSTVSATEMVHRLQEQELLSHLPYKGVQLTAVGQQQAAALIRAHHMWECFLVNQLNIPWEAAHDYACQLEHATDPIITAALADFLGEPRRCPHGNPTPTVDGQFPPSDDCPLTRLTAGESGVINRIYPESSDLLDYLAEQQLKPGVAFILEDIAPFNGPLLLRVGGQKKPLGQEIAGYIFVKRTES